MRKVLFFAIPPALLVLFFAFLRLLDKSTEPEPPKKLRSITSNGPSVDLFKMVDLSSTGDVYLGQNGAGGEYYKGELRDVVVWDRALGEAELKKEEVPSDPAAFWPLDGQIANLAKDKSRNGIDGTLIGGVSWSEMSDRKALSFDGTSGYVRVPRARGLESPALTISCWIKRKGNQSGWANVLRKTWRSNTEPTFISWGLQLNPDGQSSDALSFNTGFNGGFHSLVAKGVIPDGQWTRVVAVFDPLSAAPQKRLYVNGSPVASAEDVRPLAYDVGDSSWTLRDRELVSPTVSDSSGRLVISYLPPEEYDLIVVGKREKGKEAIHLGLRCGRSEFAVVIDGLEKGEYKSGIDRVDERGFRDNATSISGKQISSGRRFTLKCLVRSREIQVLLDDKLILRWEGNPGSLSTSWFFRFPRPNSLYLGAFESTYSISEIRLDPMAPDPRKDP